MFARLPYVERLIGIVKSALKEIIDLKLLSRYQLVTRRCNMSSTQDLSPIADDTNEWKTIKPNDPLNIKNVAGSNIQNSQIR